MTYTITGMRGLECVGFTSRQRPAAVIRQAQHLAIDKGADTVWVATGGRTAYTFDGMFWQKHAGDEALAAAIEETQR